jgi:hypothetical protein
MGDNSLNPGYSKFTRKIAKGGFVQDEMLIGLNRWESVQVDQFENRLHRRAG